MQVTLEYILNSEKPISDPPTLIAKLASFGPTSNAEAVWSYLQENWDAALDSQEASG